MSQLDHTPKQINLTKGKIAFVCTHDYEWVMNLPSLHAWFQPKSGKFYARYNVWNPETKRNRTISLHQTIAKTPKGMVTDHKNQDTLDNTCGNLRIVNHSQNQWNRPVQKNSTTGIRGVFFHKRDKYFTASIRINSKLKWLGKFETKEEAAKARHQAEVELFGEYNSQQG